MAGHLQGGPARVLASHLGARLRFPSRILTLGCEYAQGYAFGHPISAIEARKLVGAATAAA